MRPKGFYFYHFYKRRTKVMDLLIKGGTVVTATSTFKADVAAVSYTHLDVYKRQDEDRIFSSSLYFATVLLEMLIPFSFSIETIS